MTPTGPDNDPQFTSLGNIKELRDDQHLSWAKIAEALGFGSPGAARRAYSAVVRPHNESTLPAQARAATVQPVHLAGADLAAVRKAIVGRTIVVQRKGGTEDMHVAKVTSLKDGTVNLHDGNKARSVKAEAIIACK